jgi:hypothetical protein
MVGIHSICLSSSPGGLETVLFFSTIHEIDHSLTYSETSAANASTAKTASHPAATKAFSSAAARWTAAKPNMCASH